MPNYGDTEIGTQAIYWIREIEKRLVVGDSMDEEEVVVDDTSTEAPTEEEVVEEVVEEIRLLLD